MIDFLLMNKSCLKLRLDKATREKWRISDGKCGEWCVFMFRALKVVAPLESFMDHPVLGMVSKFQTVVAHARFMRFCKFNSIDGH
jgi:hypothetical protein